MSSLPIGGHENGFGATQRTDAWWQAPAAVFAGFSAFVVYVTWAAFQGEHYFTNPYLSPLYSPVTWVNTAAAGSAPLSHAWFGTTPGWWPSFLPYSPAFFILPFPGLFRLTCYYYRKAYYRAFVGSPPACAVGPASKKKYEGETKVLLFQILHRYTMYFAVIFVFILYYDAFIAFFKDGKFGFGVGTFVLLLNATLLGCYTFGCHSFRHLIGGRQDCMTCVGKPTLRYKGWKRSSWLNARHQLFAWLSLFWVGFTDVYVRLVSMGVITDLNTWS